MRVLEPGLEKNGEIGQEVVQKVVSKPGQEVEQIVLEPGQEVEQIIVSEPGQGNSVNCLRTRVVQIIQTFRKAGQEAVEFLILE